MADIQTHNRGFILIVEDSPNASDQERGLLKTLGMEIRAAYSAKQAIEILKSGLPAIMILDYCLPDMNALELLAELKRNNIQAPPFIVVTGEGGEKIAVELMKSGARDYIVKDSAMFDTLLNRVTNTLANIHLEKDLKSANLRTDEERNKFKTLFNNISDAIFVQKLGPGGLENNFTDVNDIACARLGYTKKELLNLNPAELEAKDIEGSGPKAVEIIGADGHTIFTAAQLTKDGRRIPVEVSQRYFNYGGAQFLLSLVRDITERTRAEESMKETAEIKSRFASMVSHELRTPLTSILLGISLILEDASDLNAEHKSLLELVHGNASRMGRLINNILDFQKMLSGKMTFDIRETDITDLVRTAARTMGLLAKNKGLDLTADLSPGIPLAMADKDKIIQVLTNLLANAIAHTEKGVISVHAGYVNNMLRVTVRDTGCGIKAEDLPKLFQPFTQLARGNDRKTEGTGLGLVITKEIILAHNGKIWAESEPGKGSVFYFELPVKQ